MHYEYAGLITCVISLLQVLLAFRVGTMRSKHKVQSYETYMTKNTEFIIAHRIQVNTLESVMVFLPLLWVATFWGYEIAAAIIWWIWIISRILYAVMYQQDPKKRMIPFLISLLCTMGVLLLAILGILL